MNHSVLTTFRFPEGTCIPQAQPVVGQPITLQSPGVSVMTDLTTVRAATTSPDTPLTQARQSMIHQGVRLLFVVSDLPCVDGLITSTDLEGERPMQVISQRGVKYDELLVTDVMSPLAMLDVIDFDELSHTDVAKVIATLRHVGRRHMLVVERARADRAACVRGVISHTQIERQLGQSLDLLDLAGTFAEIRQSLAA